MDKKCIKIIDDVWLKLQKNQKYKTPDYQKGADFKITEKLTKEIHIEPQGIYIKKESFLAALLYLFQNEHTSLNKCEIRSSNSRSEAGPLCLTSRDKNLNVRCINYIIPILNGFNIVGIDSDRPNKTWLVNKDLKAQKA